MESSLRGHAAAFLQQQQLQFQNQQYHQQQLRRSHRSGEGSVAGSTQDHMSVGSHYSRDSRGSVASGASSQVDEAYRRLGRRLSSRAHGEGPIPLPQRVSRIGLTPLSLFAPYGENQKEHAATGMNGENKNGTQDAAPLDRTAKVAKTRYSDHGNHNHHKVLPQSGNVLKKMTMNATELFKTWQEDSVVSSSRRSKNRSSPKTRSETTSSTGDNSSNQTGDTKEKQPDGENALSPHRHALSQLALDGKQQAQQQTPSTHPHDQLPENLLGDHGMRTNGGTGLLSAVIETASIASSQSNTPNGRESAKGSIRSMPSVGTAQSKSSISSLRTLPRGKCLTQPHDPVSNNGLDNAEGNMIVHENDAISVSRKQIHVLTKEKMKNVQRADFRIQGLLGQGTFAQVFRCLHVQTGNVVAIKVVKNKPAYTRQAAVEIDIFRALTKGTPKSKPVPTSSQSQKLSTCPSGHSTTDDMSIASHGAGGNNANENNKWDYMVDLVCYFMHQNHLCLVFELLGLNLYEILKKRQFRGLPLSIVRTLVKQAVTGVKELGKNNIVHCDLKPENILLVTENDVDSVVSAGERGPFSTALKSAASSCDKKADSTHKVRKKLPSSIEKKGALGEPPMTPSCVAEVVDGNASNETPVAINALSQSPTNSLATAGTTGANSYSLAGQQIKLIDFGSACFEGQTAHTYIQSRFYRSPEVLIGLPYDSAIDMWSLGCVAAELFLGLPILPGVHEHDQLGRICEMISRPTDWMLDQGSKASKYFIKYLPKDDPHVLTPTPPPETPPSGAIGPAAPRLLPQWRVRTQQEYIASLSQSEIRKKGGLAKLEKQPANRYFKRKELADIIAHKGQSGSAEDSETLDLFVHFLYGILDPDPWKRWTALQAAQHPFLVGGTVLRKSDTPVSVQGKRDENQANLFCDIYWEAPWDPNICRRKLLNVQKMREKQHATRRGQNGRNPPPRPANATSHDGSVGRMQDSPRVGRQSPPGYTGNGRNMQQGLGAVMANQVLPQSQQRQAYQMSSSFSDYRNAPTNLGQVTADNASVISGAQLYPSGPLSYNEAGYSSGVVPGSFNEVDFAYALHRPGVVPMGESLSSSVDMSSPGLYSQHQQTQTMGSYGGNNRNHLRNAPSLGNGTSSAMMSRSYGEMLDSTKQRMNAVSVAAGSLGTAPSNLGQQIPSSFGHATTSLGQHPPASLGQQISGSLIQQMPAYGQQIPFGSQGRQQIPFASQGGYEGANQLGMNGYQNRTTQPLQNQLLSLGSAPMQQDPNSAQNNLQLQQMDYGNAQVNAQAYLQQQHAALQQQQLLLQQQQAALALQQQQLQAYGLSPGMINGSALAPAGPQLAGMNHLAQPNGGYYYVASADGTPMMVSAAAVQQPGMPYGIPQQAAAFGGIYPNGVAQNSPIDPSFQVSDPNQYSR